MNRRNIDNIRFIDLDELMIMEIVPIRFEAEDGLLKNGFRVDGITKLGNRLESLFVDKQSGKDLACQNFITSNWVKLQK